MGFFSRIGNGLKKIVTFSFFSKPVKEAGKAAKKATTQVSTEVVQPMVTEASQWRRILSTLMESMGDTLNKLNTSVSDGFTCTGTSTFFGTLGRRTAGYLGYSESTQDKLEVIATGVAGVAATTCLIRDTNLSAKNLALIFLCYCSLPMIQQGLEKGGYETQKALGYATCLQTLILKYLCPQKSYSMIGLFGGNYAGGHTGRTVATGIANSIFPTPRPSINFNNT